MLVTLALFWPRQTSPARRATTLDMPPANSIPAVLIALLLILTISKIGVFDHVDSPLVVHLRAGRLSGTTVPMWQDFGGELRLIGSQVNDRHELTLYWQAQRAITRNYTVQVSLTDARGTLVKTLAQTHPGLGLTSYWEAGQLIRDEDYGLPLDKSQRPIGYRVSVALLDSATGEQLRLLDSPDSRAEEVMLEPLKLAPLTQALLESAQIVGTRFDEAIELSHASVPAAVRAGERLRFTLLWKSLAPVAEDYTVFVHLLNADDTQAAGGDGPPRGGLYPTSFWSQNETILDEHEVALSIPPGDYTLEVGLYRLETGERLPVSGPSAELGDRVSLAQIRVLP